MKRKRDITHSHFPYKKMFFFRSHFFIRPIFIFILICSSFILIPLSLSHSMCVAAAIDNKYKTVFFILTMI